MQITIKLLPRQTMKWRDFRLSTPPGSIALDGMVAGGPKFDAKGYRANYDHHSGVVREATMSTSKQVLFAIKGGLVQHAPCNLQLYLNDIDQDASFAAWLLVKYKLVDGTKSIPQLNRLLEITDRLDVTGGAFPMDLRDELMQRHNWVFQPYTDLRKSGQLAVANESTMMVALQAIFARIDKLLLGEAELLPIDTRHEILHESRHGYKMVNEIGGSDARYFLLAHGLNAYVSLVTRVGERYVYSIGRRSRYIPFPVTSIYKFLNKVELGWGGSDIVGGSPRESGSRFSPAELALLLDQFLDKQPRLRRRAA